MAPRSFVLMILLSSIFAMLGIMGANAFVDPYGIMPWNSAFRLSGGRPEMDTHERIFKILGIARIQPRVIVLGTSRAAHGINPDHPALAAFGNPRFNAAFDGASMGELDATLNYALQASHPSLAILGLDFMTFDQCNADADRVSWLFSGLPVSPIGRGLSFARVLSSRDTIASSMLTLAGPRNLVLHKSNGQRLNTVFEERIRERGSYQANFEKLDRDFFELYLSQGHRCFAMDDPNGNALRRFRALVRHAYESGVDLRMFVSPVHVQQLEVIRLAGLWNDYKSWLRQIAAVNEGEARRFGRLPFTLIDFSSYRGISTETLPDKSSIHQTMRWFWESSHYKESTGDLVVSQLMTGSAKFPDLLRGVALTSSTMDEHLRDLDRDQRQFLAKPMTTGISLLKIKQLIDGKPEHGR